MVSSTPSKMNHPSRDSFSGFEFISHSLDTEDNELNTATRQGHTASINNSSPIRSLADLKAAVYPPNPIYDISEKPWLPGPQKPYLLVNAKLIDPRAGVVRSNMSLQLAGGKIVRVSPTTANDLRADFYCGGQKVEKIDASKYFVCPGLIDCHVHLMAVHGSAVST